MTDTSPSIRDPKSEIRNSPAPTHVESDVPCIKCDYNLRTLPIVAHCPECNTLVCESVFNAEAARDYAKVLADMRYGCAMLLGLLLVAGIGWALVVVGERTGDYAVSGSGSVVLMFTGVIAVFLVPVGVFLMTMPLPSAVEPRRILSLRVAAIASLLAWPIVFILMLELTKLIRDIDPDRAIALLGAPALIALSPIFLLLHLRRQVRRFGYHALAALLVLLAFDTVALACSATVHVAQFLLDFDFLRSPPAGPPPRRLRPLGRRTRPGHWPGLDLRVARRPRLAPPRARHGSDPRP